MKRHVLILVAMGILLSAFPALAANIRGTNGNDVLKGTAKADRIYGRAGNDRILALAGNDVIVPGKGADRVNGGPGADRLLLRDGTRDIAICGPGRDTVVADLLDVVRRDCEVVQRPVQPSPPPEPEPTPPPAPSVPITAGSYKGDLEGNFLFFDVLADRTLTHFRSNYIQENCDRGGYVYGTLNLGDTPIAIGPDGSFRFAATDDGTVEDQPAKFTLEISGQFNGTNVEGMIVGSSEFDYQGLAFKCTSGVKTWTASLQT